MQDTPFCHLNSTVFVAVAYVGRYDSNVAIDVLCCLCVLSGTHTHTRARARVCVYVATTVAKWVAMEQKTWEAYTT